MLYNISKVSFLCRNPFNSISWFLWQECYWKLSMLSILRSNSGDFQFRTLNICVGLDSHDQSELTNVATLLCIFPSCVRKPWLVVPIGFQTLDVYNKVGFTYTRYAVLSMKKLLGMRYIAHLHV